MPTLEGATHTNIVTFTYRPARSDANKSHYDSRPAGEHAETRPRPKRVRRVWVAYGTLMGCLSLLCRLIMFDTITVSQIKEYADRGHRVGEIAAAFQIGRKAVAKIVKGQTHPNVRPTGHVKALDKMAEVVAAQKRAAERDAEHQRKKQAHEAKAAQDAVLDADPDFIAAGKRRVGLEAATSALALAGLPPP